MEKQKETTSAGTDVDSLKSAEETRKAMMTPKKVTSENLKGLSNSDVAFSLYLLIYNAGERSYEDFKQISFFLGIYAVNFKVRGVEKQKESTPASTDVDSFKSAEETRKMTMATKKVTSENLKGLSNSNVALKLYFLVNNAGDRSYEDFKEIRLFLSAYAAEFER
ncbi:hypothetical protein CD798_08315 [Bacillaceae bacterium SAOS 7]|nr:hypothetical protein CD798_08315 [Bacillaceae bacterium SAOS 7]